MGFMDRCQKVVRAHPFLALYAIALAAQLLFFWGMIHASGGLGVATQAIGDEVSYRMTAQNLIEFGVFSQSASGPLVPDSVRTPGYPMVLGALFALLGKSWTAVVGVQSVMLATIPVVLFAVLRPFQARIAWVASLAFALYPTRLHVVHQTLTDGWYTLIFLLGCWALFQGIRAPSRLRWFALAALWFGYGAIVRPAGMFVIVPVCVVIGFVFRHAWKLACARILLCTFLFSVWLLPWMGRNAWIFGTPSLTVVGVFNAASIHAIHFESWRTGTPTTELHQRLLAHLGHTMPLTGPSLWDATRYQSFADEIIQPHLSRYVAFQLYKTIPFVVHDGVAGPLERVGVLSSQHGVNLSSILLRGDVSAVVSALASASSVVVRGVGAGVWLLVWIAAALGLRQMGWDPDRRAYVYSIGLFLLYFVAVNHGPIAQGRYRLPIDGFLLFFALFFAHHVRRRFLRS